MRPITALPTAQLLTMWSGATAELRVNIVRILRARFASSRITVAPCVQVKGAGK